MLCTTTVSPLRANRSSSVSSGLDVSLPRGFVRDDPVQNLAVELAFLVLVRRADAHVPDPLSSHQSLQTLNLSD
jgi:hypothetical protein